LKLAQAAAPRVVDPAYGTTAIGRALAQVAWLIKANVGLEVAATEAGGWDTHVNQGADDGQLAKRLAEVDQAIGAFFSDLGADAERVLLVTMSEFGRTVRENGTGGTDHGHGNVMFVFGAGVHGGKVFGRWPGLGETRRFEGRDVQVTTDFRDVFGEILVRHLGLGQGKLKDVFPGYPSDKKRWLRVLG
jgi:uncharacterized protein (DUF1501 family)